MFKKRKDVLPTHIGLKLMGNVQCGDRAGTCYMVEVCCKDICLHLAFFSSAHKHTA